MFADDTQINNSAKPDEFDNLALSLRNCVKDLSIWMQDNKLKLNDDKTEAIRFTYSTPTYAECIINLPLSISLNDVDLPFSDTSLTSVSCLTVTSA